LGGVKGSEFLGEGVSVLAGKGLTAPIVVGQDILERATLAFRVHRPGVETACSYR
jgi:hypothetical protein